MPVPVFVQSGTAAAKGTRLCTTEGCENLVKKRPKCNVCSVCWAMSISHRHTRLPPSRLRRASVVLNPKILSEQHYGSFGRLGSARQR